MVFTERVPLEACVFGTRAGIASFVMPRENGCAGVWHNFRSVLLPAGLSIATAEERNQEFTVLGIPCGGLNGGPTCQHTEASSFQVATDNQEATDRYRNAIARNGRTESACG
jgi:3-demethylubiquinone-9 3-methyltransferase